MKWVAYLSIFVVGLGVVLNLEHFVEDITVEEETLFTRKPKIPPNLQKRILASAAATNDLASAKILTVQEAIKKNPPHGRSWEYLPQDEFAAEVEEWVDVILESAGLDISDKDVMMIGQHFYKYNDPYLRYLGLTLMYRSGPEKAWRVSLLWHLSNHPHFGDYYIEDETSAAHERLVRQKLIVELTDRYGGKIVSDLKNDSTEEEFFEIRSRFKYANEAKSKAKEDHIGLMKVDSLFDFID